MKISTKKEREKSKTFNIMFADVIIIIQVFYFIPVTSIVAAVATTTSTSPISQPSDCEISASFDSFVMDILCIHGVYFGIHLNLRHTHTQKIK